MNSFHTTNIKIPTSDFYDLTDSDNVCFLCEHPHYKLRYEITHFGFPFRFQECECGLVKQTPMPNEKFFEWFFNSDLFFSAKESQADEIWGFYDYFKDEPCRFATSRFRYRKLNHIWGTKHPLQIMKIGPSTGTFLYIANQHHHHAIGCDISSQFIDYAKKNYDVHIDHGRFEHMDYNDGQFDVIILFNVIENIPNQAEFFGSVRRKLKPGGNFILNYVDMKDNLIAKFQKNKYFIYRPPICYLYDSITIGKVLNKFGFKIVQSYRDIRYLHLEKIFTLLRWKSPLKLCRLLHIDHILFPIYAYPSRILVAQRD